MYIHNIELFGNPLVLGFAIFCILGVFIHLIYKKTRYNGPVLNMEHYHKISGDIIKKIADENNIPDDQFANFYLQLINSPEFTKIDSQIKDKCTTYEWQTLHSFSILRLLLLTLSGIGLTILLHTYILQESPLSLGGQLLQYIIFSISLVCILHHLYSLILTFYGKKMMNDGVARWRIARILSYVFGVVTIAIFIYWTSLIPFNSYWFLFLTIALILLPSLFFVFVAVINSKLCGLPFLGYNYYNLLYDHAADQNVRDLDENLSIKAPAKYSYYERKEVEYNASDNYLKRYPQSFMYILSAALLILGLAGTYTIVLGDVELKYVLMTVGMFIVNIALIWLFDVFGEKAYDRAANTGYKKDTMHEWRYVGSNAKSHDATNKDVYEHIHGHGSWNEKLKRTEKNTKIWWNFISIVIQLFIFMKFVFHGFTYQFWLVAGFLITFNVVSALVVKKIRG